MKKVILVHRWDGNPQADWYQSVAKVLSENGYTVELLEMPNTAKPEINAWVNKLKSVAKQIDKETYFIGHSMGCQTIMRFLEQLPATTKIGGCIFVAGWFKLANLESKEIKEIAKPWTEKPINFEKVKSHTNKITVILSSNDPYNFVEENAKDFKENLGAKVIIERDKGHFTEYDNIHEFPLVIAELQALDRTI